MNSLTRRAAGSGRGGCQGDGDVIIRVLTAGASALVGAVEAIAVATATAVCKHSTSERIGVVVPANETAATRSDRHRQRTDAWRQYNTVPQSLHG